MNLTSLTPVHDRTYTYLFDGEGRLTGTVLARKLGPKIIYSARLGYQTLLEVEGRAEAKKPKSKIDHIECLHCGAEFKEFGAWDEHFKKEHED